MSLQAYGGAIADVPDEAAAFSQRGTLFEFVAATRWTDPAEDRTRAEAVRTAAAAIAPHASGMYANIVNDEGSEALRRTYSDAKLARLVALKDEYDPSNVFRLNHNILPSRDLPAQVPADLDA